MDFVLNQFIVQCLEYTSQKREICLLLKNSLDLLYQTMESILYTQMEVHGMMKHVNVIGLKHYLHSSIEKSLMERVNQYLKDRIESFDDYYPCMQN